jgi:hypothetical protein
MFLLDDENVGKSRTGSEGVDLRSTDNPVTAVQGKLGNNFSKGSTGLIGRLTGRGIHYKVRPRL